MDRRAILKDRARASFLDVFGEEPSHYAAAPGRVNLIGEHTDYNDGFVLPCAIDFETIVAIGTNAGTTIDVVASDFGNERDCFDAAKPFVSQAEEWKNHVRGVTASITSKGHALRGAKLAVAGNVPQGAGLSSSASLSVALVTGLAQLNQLPIDPTEAALIAQCSENDFVGCACGIMDQLVSARAEAGSAMLLDCRTLETKAVGIDEDIAIMVIHSGIERGLVDSAYNERRQQCERAAEHYGVSALRDIDVEQLEADCGDLDKLSFRRARHVVTENARTLDAAAALAKNDLATLSVLMRESHQSMRDDFEITLPPIDRLAEIIDSGLGELGGVRMTGGGFGGCVVALAPKNLASHIEDIVAQKYRTPDGGKAKIIRCSAAGGASII